MKQLVKTAIIGYCGYKAIDILMSKNESAEVKDEEYVSFDELEIKEDGEYCIYIVSATSDYLTLQEERIWVE